MKISPLDLDGLLLIRPEPLRDERGSFARTFCKRELAAAGFDIEIVQQNVSENVRRGTLRGLHYQVAPHEEPKIVWCIRGSIFDVAVDLRAGSATRGHWRSVELQAETGDALAIPAGFAHGFQTLVDDTVVGYSMGDYHAPDAGRGIRWDDPALSIPWPIAEPILSARDRGWPGL